jgi:hypothetical protein
MLLQLDLKAGSFPSSSPTADKAWTFLAESEATPATIAWFAKVRSVFLPLHLSSLAVLWTSQASQESDWNIKDSII